MYFPVFAVVESAEEFRELVLHFPSLNCVTLYFYASINTDTNHFKTSRLTLTPSMKFLLHSTHSNQNSAPDLPLVMSYDLNPAL